MNGHVNFIIIIIIIIILLWRHETWSIYMLWELITLSSSYCDA